MARTAELPVKVALSNAWVVSPGDRLVLGYAAKIDQATADVIMARFAEKLPGVEVVIADGITAMAVYKPEQQSA